MERMESDPRGQSGGKESWSSSTKVATPEANSLGEKFPLQRPTLTHYEPVYFGAADMLPLLLNVKERDRFGISKQEVACAGIEDLLAVGHLYLFGDLILQILDQKLK